MWWNSLNVAQTVTRNGMIAFTLLQAFLSFGQSAPTQSAIGPAVFLNMDQAQLDAAYTQSVWAPNLREVLARYKSRSDAFLAKGIKSRRVMYGHVEPEGMDVYIPDGSQPSNGKILIFIHGGAWSGGLASEYAFLAEPFLNAGVIVVIPDFSKAQDPESGLLHMADQVRRAVAYCFQHASDFGGNPSELYLSGHSSGGHLATVAATTDWSAFNVKDLKIKGLLTCSGMYDLRPVRLSSRSKFISFTDEVEQSLSPQRHLLFLSAKTTVVYGSAESPEFKRQAIDFSGAAMKMSKNVSMVEAIGYNHFEILETMADKNGLLCKEMLTLMGLLK